MGVLWTEKPTSSNSQDHGMDPYFYKSRAADRAPASGTARDGHKEDIAAHVPATRCAVVRDVSSYCHKSASQCKVLSCFRAESRDFLGGSLRENFQSSIGCMSNG